MFFVKKNYFVDFRTTDTPSDPKVWEKSNKFAGLVFLIAGIFLIFFTFISYFLRFNWWFKYYLLFFLSILFIVLTICIIYSKRVSKESKATYKPFTIPNFLVIITLIISIIITISGIIMIFIPQNSFIGIRVAKTLSNPILWKKVNTLGGIGFTIIGLIF